ncbi:CvfB family protein [Desulfobacter curvatus]|uniref:CvfB family protein n=1 Tax=Desulfobacter curvatus TaxID=2290 RepID=UPI00037F7CC9|nr:S1-like domain-containing RNA-binding protein [Desulfobacter curvatus]
MSGKKPNIKNAWKHARKPSGKPNKSALETSIQIGKYNRLGVQTESDFGVYLNLGEDRVLLPNKYVPESLSIGDFIDVFVYTDSEDRLVATTLKPAGVVGDFVFLTAKDVAPFGTFMDWGLEKDLLVPKNEQQDRMTPGKKYLVKICRDDRTHRVYGTTKISANCDKNTRDLKVGQQVDLIIHTITAIGIMAVVDNRYYGMMYLNETYQKLFTGDTCKGYIMRIREDGKIDLSMKKPGYSSIPKSAEVILYRLNKSGGFIPCHDKSSPEEIRRQFSMSKKEFKRAVGNLYKRRLIELKNNGIALLK